MSNIMIMFVMTCSWEPMAVSLLKLGFSRQKFIGNKNLLGAAVIPTIIGNKKGYKDLLLSWGMKTFLGVVSLGGASDAGRFA